MVVVVVMVMTMVVMVVLEEVVVDDDDCGEGCMVVVVAIMVMRQTMFDYVSGRCTDLGVLGDGGVRELSQKTRWSHEARRHILGV